MPITSKDIAEMAGVSRGTVDRVINNRPGVKDETRQRIEAIIKELNYVPNRAGKALSSAGRPLEIGIIINRGNNRFYDQVLTGMEHCKDDYADFKLKYHYTFLPSYDVEQQVEAMLAFRDSGVSFVVVTPINHPRVIQAVEELHQHDIPVITLNSDIKNSRRLLHIGCDYFGSGRTAAGLLGLIAGDQALEVGIVTGSHKILGHTQRVSGFLSLLKSHSPRLQHVETVESADEDHLAYEEVKGMLTRHPSIGALYFAASGVEGGLKAMLELRKENPPYIVTCDDFDPIKQMVLEGYIQATVCQEPFRQGYDAIHQGLQYSITGQDPQVDSIYMQNEIKIAQNIEASLK